MLQNVGIRSYHDTHALGCNIPDFELVRKINVLDRKLYAAEVVDAASGLQTSFQEMLCHNSFLLSSFKKAFYFG
jgi:hypothetical protein